ncbi:MAG: chromosome segregation protein SMC, partial [Eubacteriales bacterium]
EKISQRDALESEKNKVFDEEKKLFEHKEKLAREAERMQIRQATLRNDSDSIIAKIWDEYELTLTQAREGGFKTDMPLDDAKKRVAELRASIKALGSVNVGAIEEFAQVKQRHDELEEQTADLTKSRDELLGIISGLVEEMTRIFAEQFKTINAEFSRVYRELFNGGSARLELTDSENLLESGIEIYVAPPGKIIKHLSALSGGEQSLTAIALYFALLHIRPAPFCLLDEIESALDDVNVVRYAQYLSNLSHKTQFLLITHRRGTMEIADRLYGVTMREKGVSKMLTINVKDLANENI